MTEALQFGDCGLGCPRAGDMRCGKIQNSTFLGDLIPEK